MRFVSKSWLLASLLLLTGGLFGSVSPAAAGTLRTISCSSLPGAGTYSNPFRIGAVTTTTVVTDCAPLTSGSGFNTRYFSFTLTQSAPSGSAVGMITTLTPTAQSAVHPGLINPTNGWVIADSMSEGFWIGQYPTIGRFLNISPLQRYNIALPAGAWVLRASKLDSPLRSLTTPSYHVVIFLGD